MAQDNSQSTDVDLDRTDRLPILAGTVFDADVEDDAVRMESPPAAPILRPDFARPSGVDLPSLAESVRSVEERIARQTADYETLSRSYARVHEAEAAAVARAQALTADLAGMRSLLESEQARSRELDKSLADKHAALDTAKARVEDTLRETERFQGEARTLRDTLAARDAALGQVLHSLGERDAQLNALQREHAQVVPALEERSRAATELEADLRVLQERTNSLAAELHTSHQSAASYEARLHGGEQELGAVRRELGLMKTRSASYLESLRTREWRLGFDQNLFRELDARIGAAQEDRGVLQSERDRLRQYATELESKLAAREEAVEKLNSAAAGDRALRAKHEIQIEQMESSRAELGKRIDALEVIRTRLNNELTTRDELVAQLKAAAAADDAARAHQEFKLQQVDGVRLQLADQITALESDRDRLNRELAAKEGAVADALAVGISEVERGKDLLSAAEKTQLELSARIEKLLSEVQTRDDEMAVLVAHLHEARRPLESFETEIKRLNDELAAKAVMLEQLDEDNRSLRAGLERARGALEEREFLIRRLERSESNNANVLGRIQTSIERLGASGSVPGAAAPLEFTAELIRTDGERNTAHVLARRTRVGRAPGCEMQIESSSVSRHHALLLLGSRDVVIEDLNSTNGVIVNGRRVSRQSLSDGDLLTIGDAQFRLSLKMQQRALEAPAPDPQQ